MPTIPVLSSNCAVEESARTMGWSVTTLEIRQAEDIPLALKGIGARVDALYVGIDPGDERKPWPHQ